MKIQTFSVVVGNQSCNARCPFCVAKMTSLGSLKKGINYRNLEIGCLFAKQNGVSTALITGKGEPMLFPQDVLSVCGALQKQFPFIELQTNGSLLHPAWLREAYDFGLTTVIISMVHHDDEINNQIYQHKDPINLKNIIRMVHDARLSVRLSCIMLKGYVDSISELDNLIDFCKANEVEQLTVRSVETPEISQDGHVYFWTTEHKIGDVAFKLICNHCASNGKLLMNLAHDAKVYDYHGQNICISNCLTLDPNPENIRQLIFFPDGHLKYDWVYPGAILI